MSNTAAMGGFTNSTHRQPGPSVSTPPRNTPAADARAATPAQAPTAFGRSVPELNSVVSSDSAAGIIIAAPKPWAIREPTSAAELPANPPVNDEIANNVVPAIRIRRLPSRSAIRPPSSMNPP